MCKVKYKKKIELILIIISTTILLAFGTWQLKRLEYKNNLINSIEETIKNPPKTLASEENTKLYSKVTLTGNFNQDQNIFLYGRRSAYPEKDGYYVLTPFTTINNETYLVSRGWISHSTKVTYNSHIPTNKAISYQPETITAITLSGESKTFMVPENDLKNNIWFTLNLNQAKEVFNTSNLFYLMQIESTNNIEAIMPLNTNHLSKIRNDHLEYAMTWYSLAIALVVMYIYYRIKQKSDS